MSAAVESAPLRVAIIASARYPLREPFAGGLEAVTWQLAVRLRARGHQVTVFGGADSDPALHVREMAALPTISEHARRDVSMPPEWFLAEHHAYLHLMVGLARSAEHDIVHNNSLHYLPLAMADTLPVPLLTTLHTPPTPWLESAVTVHPGARSHFTAVSRSTADLWSASVAARVLPNGVDTAAWRQGPGGGTPIWWGRIVPEKGPAEAIHAARRAGTGLRLAGPTPDLRFFREHVEPLLGGDVSYLGHLDHAQLAHIVGSASVAVASPCWDEPYSLVIAEALSCGTPVAGFSRGALPDLIDDTIGVLAPPGDIDALAAAIVAASKLDRDTVRRHAEAHCSVETMVDRYELLYREICEQAAA